jgi:hypothetical protein
MTKFMSRINLLILINTSTMAERLVILSDMWGSKKGLWITSYLGYLQQYFDIVFYDSQQLTGIESAGSTTENICEALAGGGVQRAAKQLIRKEKIPSHYLTFCAGGTIAWQAALMGLPVKSLYSVSPVLLSEQLKKPSCPVKLMFGEYQEDVPSESWAVSRGIEYKKVQRFGRELYSDEKIIREVCMNLLDDVLKKQYQG